jgi:hypothetical protein
MRCGQGQTSRKSTSRPIPYRNCSRCADILADGGRYDANAAIKRAEVRMIDDAGYFDGNGATS